MNPRDGASSSAAPRSAALRLDVRTTAGASGAAASVIATSSPEASGRSTSSSTAAGRSSRAAASAVAPSPASPTTANPASSSRSLANRRNVGWSSTISTVTFMCAS